MNALPRLPGLLIPFGFVRRFLCKEEATSSVFSLGTEPQPADAALSDNALAILAQSDPDRFGPLFERYFRPVYRFFMIRLRQKEDAEDLTSRTFEKAFSRIGTFRERGTPFAAWLFAIAHNCLIDHYRSLRQNIESLDELDPDDEPSEDFDTRSIERAILSPKLWDAVATLPERQQRLWALKLTSDLPHAEIARILGTTENNVNVMVHRSLSSLKKRLRYLAS